MRVPSSGLEPPRPYGHRPSTCCVYHSATRASLIDSALYCILTPEICQRLAVLFRTHNQGTLCRKEQLAVSIAPFGLQNHKGHGAGAPTALTHIGHAGHAGHLLPNAQTSLIAIALLAMQQLHLRGVDLQLWRADPERCREGWRGIDERRLALQRWIAGRFHKASHRFLGHCEGLGSRGFADQAWIDRH